LCGQEEATEKNKPDSGLSGLFLGYRGGFSTSDQGREFIMASKSTELSVVCQSAVLPAGRPGVDGLNGR
jgi:hypothetical protein